MVEIKPFAPREDALKEDEPVCYCFQYTKKDIEADFMDHGRRSTILEKIALEKQMGRCHCAEKNPKGR